MSQHYSDSARKNDPHALPDVEVFHADIARRCEGCGFISLNSSEATCDCEDKTEYAWESAAGWYWQSCFPGCLPDGEPVGPFATEADALADARGDAR